MENYIYFLVLLITEISNTIRASPMIASVTMFDATQKKIGFVNFSQETSGHPVFISGKVGPLPNLVVNMTGLHIHEYGSFANNCTEAGAHYNPLNQSHGAPSDKIRHVGDLGNVEIVDRQLVLNFTDSTIQLKGAYSIVGRSLVLHGATDDYGRNASSWQSAKTGNEGVRLACGVIGVVSDFNLNGNNGRRLFPPFFVVYVVLIAKTLLA